MFEKKAQITIFVIIGFVLLLGVLAYLHFSNSQVEKSLDNQFELSSDSDVATVQELIVSCTNNVVRDTLPQFSSSSFLTPLSAPSLKGIHYFYFSGKSLYPERVVVERRYADFIRPKILACLDSYNSVKPVLSKQLVEDKDLDVNISLFDTAIAVDVNPNLVLKDDSSSTPINSVSIFYPSRVGLTYAIGRAVLFPPANSSVFYDFARNLSTNNNFYFSIEKNPAVAGDLLVTIEDFDADPLHPNSLSYLMHYGYY